MTAVAGKRACVLGASSGFGRAIAERLAAEGARVVVAARREKLLHEVAEATGASVRTCDITDDDQVRSLIDFSCEELGSLDVAVNCAGYEQLTPLRQLEPDELRQMTEVQLHGAVFFLRHAANAMADRSGGSIVTISSLTAHRPAEGLVAYGGAKRAIEYVTEIAALEYGAGGVRANCVAAALIETPMTEAMFRNPIVPRAFIEQTPLGRMGTIEDIVEAVAWLASDAASFVTGQTLRVDGGNSLTRLPSTQNFLDAATRAAKP